MSPPFTVVVATYNRPGLLAEALASIQAQTVSDFECLVVDDGSNTADPAVPADDRFRLISLEQNGGLAHAWNVGVAEAVGDAVTFLDDDDLWTPERLELARRGLERADVAICGSRWLHRSRAAHWPTFEGNVHDHILDAFTPNMGRTAVRREAKLPFDERYMASQDVEWWIRQSATSEVATERGLGLLSRAHDGPRTTNGLSARVASGERMLAEHADYFEQRPRARAFRQYRIGSLLAQMGQHHEARRWFSRSLRTAPSRRAAWSMLRSARPSRS